MKAAVLHFFTFSKESEVQVATWAEQEKVGLINAECSKDHAIVVMLGCFDIQCCKLGNTIETPQIHCKNHALHLEHDSLYYTRCLFD